MHEIIDPNAILFCHLVSLSDPFHPTKNSRLFVAIVKLFPDIAQLDLSRFVIWSASQGLDDKKKRWNGIGAKLENPNWNWRDNK